MTHRIAARWAGTVLGVFLVRTGYAGPVHGPLLLSRFVYARFPAAMNPTLQLPALLAVEAVTSLLLVGSYAAYFGGRRPRGRIAALFGVWFGAVVYLPQNLLNGILLSPVRPPLVAAWILAGLGSGVVSAVVCRALAPLPTRA